MPNYILGYYVSHIKNLGKSKYGKYQNYSIKKQEFDLKYSLFD